MKSSLLWSVVVAAAVVAGCATTTSNKSDYDTTYDFSRLKSYDWFPSPPGDQMEEMTEKRVEGAVNSQLQAKGFNRSTGSPDFLVSVEGVKKTVSGGSAGVGASIAVPVGHRGAVSVGGGKSRPREKQEGTLSLNIVDAKTKTVIWKGTATRALNENSSPEEQQQRIDQVITEMLKAFPPVTGR